jgi:signal recognition particle GTPase
VEQPNLPKTDAYVYFTEMLDAMTDKELDDPLSMDMAARERVSRAANKSVDDVTKLLHYHKQTLVMQQWLMVKCVRRQTALLALLR